MLYACIANTIFLFSEIKLFFTLFTYIFLIAFSLYVLGYNGMQCQLGQSECHNGSCPDRAMCQDLPGIGTINCLCRTGYEGPACNITINPCTSGENPCLNGATCMPLQQGRYKCICPPGLTGPTCDIDIGNFAQLNILCIMLYLLQYY